MKWCSIMKSKKTIFSLCIILLLAAGLRLYRLGEIPVGHTNDEANFIYSAYSIWHTGRDLNGYRLPLSFNLFNSFEPGPVYLTAPFVGLLGLSSLGARLPFAMIGIFLVVLIFLMTRVLIKNDLIAFFSSFVVAVSPWHIQLSRMVFTAPLGLFFGTLGIFIFLIAKKKGNIVWSLWPFLLAFYSYHAFKVYFVFLIPFLVFFFWQEISQRRKELALFLVGSFLIFLSFFYLQRTQEINRQKVFLWNRMEKVEKIVNYERATSQAPYWLKVFFNNKPSTFFRLVRENYLKVFSLEYLFLFGETGYSSEIYGLSSKHGDFSRGMLYLIELPLLLLGINFLLKTQKKIRNFIFFGLLLAPLPSAFTIDQTYGARSVMLLPFLSITIGCGIYQLKSWLEKQSFPKTLFRLLLLSSVVLYLVSIIQYLYQYYYRFPIYSSETWLKSRREIVELMDQEKSNYERVWITNAGDLLIQYAIFNRVDPKLTQAAYQSESPQVENVYFIGDCLETNEQSFDPKLHLPPNTLYITHEACHEETEVKPIKIITEVGEPLHTIWKIYERKE